MDNEEVSYHHWQERTQELAETGMPKPAHPLAQELKEAHEEALPELQGFAADLLNAAFHEVNWYEIAESLLTDLEEEAKDD
jgi:hypothetical protein